MGTLLALMMSTVALSLPEMILLRRALKPPLLAIFAGVVAAAIWPPATCSTPTDDHVSSPAAMLIKILCSGCANCAALEQAVGRSGSQFHGGDKAIRQCRCRLGGCTTLPSSAPAIVLVHGAFMPQRSPTRAPAKPTCSRSARPLPASPPTAEAQAVRAVPMLIFGQSSSGPARVRASVADQAER
jgi:hypothetical protein